MTPLRSKTLLAAASLALLLCPIQASASDPSDPAGEPDAAVRSEEAAAHEARAEPEPAQSSERSAQRAPEQPATASARFGTRTLRRGLRGPDVRKLQSILRQLGYRTVVDGDFGPATEADVRRYERRRGVRVDGRVPPRQARTMQRLAARRGRSPSRSERRRYTFGERTLRRGMSGPDVRALQEALTKLGFPTEADGAFGPATESQVRAYERRRGLRVDGRVSPRQARGMRRRAAAAPTNPGGGGRAGYVFPVRGRHSYGDAGARFGADRGNHSHQGQDVFAAAGTPLVAAHAGRVAYRQYQAGGAGNYVVIHGSDRTDYVYMHMQSPSTVRPGQTVAAGQSIGRVGCTGRCSGAHLHFEMWTPHWYDGGRPFDPLPSLRRWDR